MLWYSVFDKIAQTASLSIIQRKTCDSFCNAIFASKVPRIYNRAVVDLSLGGD